MSTPNNADAKKNEIVIEPPCDDCLKARAASGDPKAWCARHSEHHVHGHTYSYNRELPLDTNDANVIPTGLNQAGKSDPGKGDPVD